MLRGVLPRVQLASSILLNRASSTHQIRHAPTQAGQVTGIGNYSLSKKVRQGDPPVTMVILGWAWMSDSQINRFAKMHQELGHHTLTYTMDAPLLFAFDYEAQMEISGNLYKQLRAAHPDCKDIFLHSFSNTGYAVHQHLSHMLEKDRNLNMRGAILDSAPSFWNFSNYIFGKRGTGRTNILLPLWIYFYLHINQQRRGIFAALKDAWKLWPTLRVNWSAYASVHQTTGVHLLHERHSYPLMFMYSQGDHIIPASFVELCAQQCRELDRSVVTEDFGKSGHVAHCKSDPARYKQCVQDFVQLCMSEQR